MMESCLLCLEISKDILDCINVTSTRWHQFDIKKTIEKHFWSLDTIQPNSWICLSCWREVNSFHTFYLRVEEAHLNFGKIKVEDLAVPGECEEELIQHFTIKVKGEESDKDNIEFCCLEPEILIEQTKQEMIIDQSPHTLDLVLDKETAKTEPLGELDLDDMPLSKTSKHMRLRSGLASRDPLEKYKKFKQKKHKSKVSVKKKSTRESKSDNTRVKDEDLSDNISKLIGGKNDASDVNYEESKDNSAETLESERFKDYSIQTMKRIENDKFIVEHFKLLGFKFICDLCQEPSENFSSMQKHFIKVHKQRGYVVCCKRKHFKRGDLVDHIHCHINPDHFKCAKCNKVLSDRLRLEKHVTRVHGSEVVVKKHSCDVCGKSYFDGHYLRRHKLTHLAEEEKKFPCEECGKFYASSDFLHRHIQAVHLRKFVKICYICGKSLSSGADLKNHMNKHEGIPQPIISCDVCGLRLTTERGLKTHKDSQHPVDGKKEHHCPTCPKISPTLKALRKHISTMHNKKAFDHKCTICQKVFKRAEVLREHMASHTGTPLYTCPWCPRTFNSNGNMHAHRKKIHPKEWEEAKLQKYSNNLKQIIVPRSPQ